MAYTAIDNPELHFQTKTYTGNGSSGHAITLDGDENMQPDWVWLKSRSDTEQHTAWDSSRGGAKRLMPDATNAEYDNSSQGLQSFDSDGFTCGASDQYNKSSQTVVAWNWKANGGTTTTNDASATSVGNVDSVYQANTTAGFSIVTFDLTSDSGDKTIAHGLGQAPDVIIFKNRDDARNWAIHHHTQTPPQYMVFDVDAVASSDDFNNSTDPTSTVFSLETAWHGAHKHVAYCFAEIQGYSKFGSYTGNGDADGPFVYTGFKPAFVMIKVASGNTGGWDIYDNKRLTYNPNEEVLQANASSGEASSDAIDLLSNGFKIRNTTGNQNGDGNTHIYLAFAHQPFVTSGGVPCTAH